MEKFNFLVSFNEDLKRRLISSTSLTYKKIISSPSKLQFVPRSNEALDELIKQLNEILDIIRNIFNKPYIQTITNEILLRSELVSTLNPDLLRKTEADPSLWKEKKNKKMSPELVYSVEYEDTIKNYENCFVIYVFNQIISLINTFKELNISYTNSLTNYYQTSEARLGGLSVYEDIVSNGEELGKYVFYKGSRNKNIEKLLNIHRKVKYLKYHKFYRVLKDTTIKFPLNLTNTILHDRRYNKIYRFYKDNLENKDLFGNQDVLFFNYSVIRILNYLMNNENYKLKSSDVVLSLNDNLVHFNDFSFDFDFCHYDFKCDETDLSLILKTTINHKSCTTKIKIICNLENKIDEENYDNFIVICNNNLVGKYSNICELNYEKELYSDKEIANIFNSTRIVIPVYSRSISKCPYCGETTIVDKDHDYYCYSCKGEFLTVYINKRLHVWIKSLWRFNDGRETTK